LEKKEEKFSSQQNPRLARQKIFGMGRRGEMQEKQIAGRAGKISPAHRDTGQKKEDQL
jgi:hypothetical protein